MLRSQAQVAQVAAEWPPLADVLAARFWPGPLTLVLPKRDEVPAIVTAGGPTVAVRIPAHPVALALLRAANVPIAAPSANRSNQLSPTSADHVLRGLEGRIDLILDGGPTPGGIESTVVDLTTQPPRLLRPGLLQASDLEAVCGALQRSDQNFSEKALPSPGLSPRHYAPRTPLLCVEGDGLELTQALLDKSLCVGWLKFTSDGTTTPAGVVVRTLPAEPTTAAAQLYAALHELDDANLDRILVFLPPDTAAWSAIRDRLQRASS